MWIKNILFVCAEELKKIFKDVGALVFFLIVPLLYPLLYAYLYSNETVHEVPVVVVDECHTADSREFLRKADATADINIVSYCANMEEARELIRRHKAYGLIQIPSGFTKDIVEGNQTTVNLYCDMSGLLYYKAVLAGCTMVSLDMNRDIKMQRLQGMSDREKDVMTQPVANEYIPLFNPQSGFQSFLLPAVLILLLQQTLVLGISMLAGTDAEKRKRGEAVAGHIHGKPIDVMIGRGIAYLLIYGFVSTYVLVMVPWFFNMPQMEHMVALTYFCVPFVMASIWFAMSISNFVRDRESCFLLFVFVSVPLIFMSGISWPASNIPEFWKWFSYLFPSTPAINGYVRLCSDGATLTDVITEFNVLIVQSVAYFLIAMLCARYIRIRRERKLQASQQD